MNAIDKYLLNLYRQHAGLQRIQRTLDRAASACQACRAMTWPTGQGWTKKEKKHAEKLCEN